MTIYSDFYIKSKIPPKVDGEAMMRDSIKKLQKEINAKQRKIALSLRKPTLKKETV